MPEQGPSSKKSVTYITPSYTAKQKQSKASMNLAAAAVKSGSEEKKLHNCIDDVTIPPQLPDILKQYAKAAMKTHPPDLLRWSGAYFRCLAEGDVLPTKAHLESPLRTSVDGLSPGIIRVINKQLQAKSGQKLDKNVIFKRWRGFGLTQEAFNAILTKAKMGEESALEWDKLIAVMASTIGKNMTETMSIICEVLTEQPDGSEPLVNYKMWWNLYVFLKTEVLGQESLASIEPVDTFLLPISNTKSGLIGPRSFMPGEGCPPL